MHGILHSANEIMHNIWLFSIDIELRAKIGCHFLVTSDFCLFVCSRLYIPVNNFSVILGLLPGYNQYLAIGTRTQHYVPGEDQTHNLAIKESDAPTTELLALPSPQNEMQLKYEY